MPRLLNIVDSFFHIWRNKVSTAAVRDNQTQRLDQGYMGPMKIKTIRGSADIWMLTEFTRIFSFPQCFSMQILAISRLRDVHLGKPQHKKISVHLGIARLGGEGGSKPLPGWFVAPIFSRNVHVQTGICMILPENRCHRVPV